VRAKGWDARPDLSGHSVIRHRDERRVRRESRGSAGCSADTVRYGAAERSTQGVTGRCMGGGGHKVKLREVAERWVRLGKGIVECAAAARNETVCSKGDSPFLNGVAVRDHTGGIKAETSFTEFDIPKSFLGVSARDETTR
jgi:hypothetical protein